MNTSETFLLVCSFLQPLEICRMRYLSSYHHKTCDRWLTHTRKKINLQDETCPKCGKWVSDEDITNDPTFYELLYGNIEEIEEDRIEFIQNTLRSETIERTMLLCDECTYIEEEPSNLFFRYKGNRRYVLTIIQHPISPWSFLATSNLWNECRLFIEPIEIMDMDTENVYINQIII